SCGISSTAGIPPRTVPNDGEARPRDPPPAIHPDIPSWDASGPYVFAPHRDVALPAGSRGHPAGRRHTPAPQAEACRRGCLFQPTAGPIPLAFRRITGVSPTRPRRHGHFSPEVLNEDAALDGTDCWPPGRR